MVGLERVPTTNTLKLWGDMPIHVAEDSRHGQSSSQMKTEATCIAGISAVYALSNWSTGEPTYDWESNGQKRWLPMVD